MPMLGRISQEIYQITPLGAARIQSGTFARGIHPECKRVLAALVELGGYADDDELKLQAKVNPNALKVTLRRLTDMGLISPMATRPPSRR